jgi:YVTN family beta-propeller protein
MKRLLLTLAILLLCFGPEALSQKVLGVVNVGGQPGQLAINPTTDMIYVANTTLNTVTVVDGSSNQVVTNIAMPSMPFALAVNSVTNRVYVTTGSPSNSIVVIDGLSNTVTATISNASPGLIAVNPLTNLVYFSSLSTSLGVLDGSTNQIVDTIVTADGIQGIAVNPVTNRIYLAESTPGVQMVVVDGSTNVPTTFQIPNSCFLTNVAVDSALNRVYVVDNNCSRLYVIAGASNRLLATILQGDGGLMGLSQTLHVLAEFGGITSPVLNFVNLRTDKTIASLTFPRSGKGPLFIAANNNRYYIPFSNSNEVAVVSGAAPPPLAPATAPADPLKKPTQPMLALFGSTVNGSTIGAPGTKPKEAFAWEKTEGIE